jgi:hypothetical protein
VAQSQDVNLSVAGLYTAPNDFSGVPPGALDDALNVAIDQKNLLASRRGFNWFGDNISVTGSVRGNRLSSFKTTQIADTATEYVLSRLSDDTLIRSAGPGETAGSWHAWPSTFPNPSSTAKSRFLEVNRRKYILTDEGPKLLDLRTAGSGGNIATQAGVPKALDLVATAQADPGFMSPNIAADTSAKITTSSPTLTAVSDITGIEVGMYASAPGTYASLVVQDLTYTAIVDGTFGNSITITYVDPGVHNSPLSVSVSGTDITVSLATSNLGVITSTATAVMGAIEGSDASTLVDVVVSGTGGTVQAAAVQTALAGGSAGPIPAGTKVDTINESAPIITQTGTTTAGSTSVTSLASSTGIVAGVLVTGEGIQDGTTVVSVSGGGPYTVVLSLAAYKTGTGVSLAFASAPSILLTANATGTATAIVSFYRGSQVGYRLLFIGRDSINNQLLYGAPTGLAIATNTMPTSVAVRVVTNLPSNLTMGPSVTMYVQLYRSDTTESADIPPLDQMQLVYEAAITTADTTAGKITILDQTPDSLKGLPLYTGSDREGILQANDPPPLCADAALYRDMVLYANCTLKPSLKLTLLGVSLPGGSGLQAGDVLSLTPDGGSAVDFTAVSGSPASPGEFQVVTSGTPAQNIADTANNLISAINYAPGLLPDVSPVYAYLVSGSSDLPGQILLVSKDYTAVSVEASLHGDTAWSPSIAPADDAGLTSESLPNTVLVSKQGQGVSVPQANSILVGDASSPILRVLALREYAIVLKTDGVYRITGLTPATLSPTLFDNTTRIVGPETARVLTNAVWMLSNQGVVSISDTGVEIKSDPIKNIMDYLTGPLLEHTKATAFAEGYETEKKYILAVADNSGDGFANVQYVFNYITSAWTYWDREMYAMHVAQNEDRLYLANGDSPTVSRERHDGNDGDLCDEDIDVTIVSVTGDQVVLDTVDGVGEGDIIERSSDLRALIVAVDELSNTVTVEEDTGITTGSATIKTAIRCVTQWKPVVNGANPAFARQYSEGALLFRSTRFSFGTIGFFTDADNSIDRVPIQGYAPGSWGFFPWGTIPWGGIIRPQSVRFLVPQNKQYASQLVPILVIQNALAPWTCQGLSISANPVSQEVPSAVTE